MLSSSQFRINTICSLGLLALLIAIVAQTVASVNWLMWSRTDRNHEPQNFDWEAMEAEKKRLSESVVGNSMALLANCFIRACPLADVDSLHLSVPKKLIENGLARFMRLEMGLIYPEHSHVYHRVFEDAFEERVLKPCSQVVTSLKLWSKQMRDVELSKREPSESDKDWLITERICAQVFSSPKDAFLTSYHKFSSQLVTDYRKHKRDPTWFPEEIRLFLAPTKVGPMMADLGSMIEDSIRDQLGRSVEDTREIIYELVPRQALVEGISKFLAKYASEQYDGDERRVHETPSEEELRSFNESIFDKMVVEPCSTIDKMLLRWWQATHNKEAEMSRQEDEWLRLEAICQSVLAETGLDGDQQLINEVYQSFKASL